MFIGESSLKLDFRGMFIFVPQFSNDLQYIGRDYYNLANKHDCWKNKSEKAYYHRYYEFVDELRNEKAINDDKFEDMAMNPIWKKKKNNKDEEIDYLDNICNFHKEMNEPASNDSDEDSGDGSGDNSDDGDDDHFVYSDPF